MIRSDYKVLTITDDIVYIMDLNLGNKSVTNDAENVTKELYQKYGNKRIRYQDSDGQWSELSHINGQFKGFVS